MWKIRGLWINKSVGRVLPTREVHSSSGVQSFLLRLHHIGTSDWINGHVAEHNFQPLWLFWRLGWYHIAKNPSPLVPWMVFLRLSVLILSHPPCLSIKYGPRDPSWIRDTLSLRKFQGFRDYLPGMEDKVQINSLLHTNLVKNMGKQEILQTDDGGRVHTDTPFERQI